MVASSSLSVVTADKTTFPLTGGLSMSFQGDPLAKPAVVHQHHRSDCASLPQAEVQGKGEPD